MSKVDIYCAGPLSMSVCAPKDMSREDIIADIESQHPCGTANGWMISDDKTFKDGTPMPCECEHDSNRLHWFVEF